MSEFKKDFGLILFLYPISAISILPFIHLIHIQDKVKINLTINDLFVKLAALDSRITLVWNI